MPEIEARGASLVVIGNGARPFAEAFREDVGFTGVLLVDPELRAYRAAGFRRGYVELLSPRLPLHALRALRAGYRQRAVEGDAFQLGGTLVVRPGGIVAFRHASREAGDEAPLDAVLAALDPAAPPVAEAPAPSAFARMIGRALGLVLDPTIVLSFDRTGYAVHALGFDPADLDVDLGGRTCLVTGANSGIGFETARALADLGADVVLLCRSAERGETAAARIREETGNGRVRCEVLDLADLAAVRMVAGRLAGGRVDVLVHNAGLLPAARVETADGLELTFATHVAGPHLLTALLRPALERSPDGRVVWVSSGGMYTRRLALDDPQWTARPYDGVLAYAETKRMQVVLAELWAEAFRGTRVVVNAMHPGWAETPGVATSLPRFQRLMAPLLRTPAEGADTVVWLAAAPRARELTGRFVFDRVPRRTHLVPWTRESPAERAALWALCERATAPPAATRTA